MSDTSTQKKDRRVHIRVTPGVYLKLSAAAEKNDRPISYVVRQAVEEWLGKNHTKERSAYEKTVDK